MGQFLPVAVVLTEPAKLRTMCIIHQPVRLRKITRYAHTKNPDLNTTTEPSEWRFMIPAGGIGMMIMMPITVPIIMVIIMDIITTPIIILTRCIMGT